MADTATRKFVEFYTIELAQLVYGTIHVSITATTVVTPPAGRVALEDELLLLRKDEMSSRAPGRRQPPPRAQSRTVAHTCKSSPAWPVSAPAKREPSLRGEARAVDRVEQMRVLGRRAQRHVRSAFRCLLRGGSGDELRLLAGHLRGAEDE